MYVDHNVFSRSFTDGHSDGLQVWAITNKAAMNFGVTLCMDTCFHFSGRMPRTAESQRSTFHFTFPSAAYESFSYFTFLPTTGMVSL